MKFHVVRIELILSHKRQVKRNERSEEGVGTRLSASHGAGSGPTCDYLHRATLPRPVGRAQAGPYADEASPLLKQLSCHLT